jgi:hypothetical protein
MNARIAMLLALLPALSATACIHAPDVVIVDRRTALEQQAGGRYGALEEELEQQGVNARPEPFTSGQLAASGWKTGEDGQALASLYNELSADADRIDQLLVRRCVGEALAGTLAETREPCSGGVDPESVGTLVERANRNRRQVWLYIQARNPSTSLEDVQAAWRERHLTDLVCGGHLQADDGKWTVKPCD